MLKWREENYTVTLVAGAAKCATVGTSVDGMWKKCSIKPVASKKCAIKIPPIKNTDLLEFCNAGLKMMIRTAPVDNAALNTSNHCKKEI